MWLDDLRLLRDGDGTDGGGNGPPTATPPAELPARLWLPFAGRAMPRDGSGATRHGRLRALGQLAETPPN
jgi:hypothetical protein